MAAIILTLLFAIQACIGKSVNNECCGSKTVGEFAYTLVNTTVDFPDECLNSCAYNRDDQPGSLYCFAKGEQPVTCTEYCFPGPPGPTGCPPVEDLKITDYPSTLGYRPLSNDCYDFCRALCPPVMGPANFTCHCFAWTYNTEDQMCSTFDSLPPCYDTIQKDRWISGAPCYDSDTDPIKEVDDIPGDFKHQPLTFGPFGALGGTTVNFTDVPRNNPITEIAMWTSDEFIQVIVGIQFTYNGITPKPHGNTIGKPTRTCTIQPGTFFTDILVLSTQSSDPKDKGNFVFFLQFASNDPNMDACNAGNTNMGTETIIQVTAKNPHLSFIFGEVTAAKPTLASLSFVYNAAA